MYIKCMNTICKQQIITHNGDGCSSGLRFLYSLLYVDTSLFCSLYVFCFGERFIYGTSKCVSMSVFYCLFLCIAKENEDAYNSINYEHLVRCFLDCCITAWLEKLLAVVRDNWHSVWNLDIGSNACMPWSASGLSIISVVVSHIFSITGLNTISQHESNIIVCRQYITFSAWF